MDYFIQLLGTQAVIFIYILVGMYTRKKAIITRDNQQQIIDLILKILMPCMIFSSYDQKLTADVMKKAAIIIVIAFCICITAVILGKLLYYKYPYEKGSIMKYGTIVNNSGFAGLPMCNDIFGEIGLFYASFFLIPNRIFMWTAGISLFERTDTRSKLKNVLLNPNIIAVELGLLFSAFSIKLPGFLSASIKHMGATVSPLSMIVVGAILADVDFKTIMDKSVFYMASIRLILLPLLTLGIVNLFQLDSTIGGVALVLTSMPVGTTTALLAVKYKADVEFASKCVFVTTMLSLITVPIFMMLIH